MSFDSYLGEALGELYVKEIFLRMLKANVGFG
jgi:hypothetical protein